MKDFAYSVIIPTHGRRELVLAALESVWAQTCPPSEVIVVVDGDDDGSADAVKATFPATQVVTLDGNVGAAGARNVGMARASAPWVAFLDDDDLWHSEKQEHVRRYLAEHPDCRAVRSEFWLFSAPSDPVAGAFGLEPELVGARRADLEEAAPGAMRLNDLDYLDIEGESLALMMERNRGVISGSVVQREVLAGLPPIPENLRRGQDWLLFIDVAAATEWHLLRDRLVFIRLHGRQITRSAGSDVPEHITSLLREAWARYGGRDGLSLDRYRLEYRFMIQHWMWSRILLGDLRGARSAYLGARQFIPRTRDRIWVHVPPPLTWRLGRICRTRSAKTSAR